MDSYVVLDLENPNVRGNSVCAIGILIVENGKVKEKLYTLIDPEDRFDDMNSQINGITASQVVGSPTLKEYWDKIRQLLTENIVVGHNITYDLGVLSKSLVRYDLEVPKFRYICTLQLSQAFISVKSHKLTELMKSIGYSYNAHNALEDALAANELYRYLLNNYDLSKINCSEYAYSFALKENVDEKLISHLNNLYGIIKGIEFDEIVNQEEINKIRSWESDNLIYK
ncbi:MAG TPA: 3'-5' exonuclease, partial [Lachnospiraceae bacterium]|nr:3'-5' exonuclease [Lachnospiraceae bacterium]